MNPSKKPKVLMATRFINCPHCQQEIQLTGFRPVQLGEAIREFLRQSPEALQTKKIIQHFSNYSIYSVKNALAQLKRDGEAVNWPLGYWSVEDEEEEGRE